MPGTPSETAYQSVQIDFGNVPVSGAQTFTLKLIVKSGPGSLFFETFGIGIELCDQVEETDENNVGDPTLRGDPAGFRVSSASPGVPDLALDPDFGQPGTEG
ncbi:MAG TPA: hypothetical protein VFR55_14285 [Dehalococcoidia bacterium]|nr:hypothetical protein [Dehalococcoidia bacterium]